MYYFYIILYQFILVVLADKKNCARLKELQSIGTVVGHQVFFFKKACSVVGRANF